MSSIAEDTAAANAALTAENQELRDRLLQPHFEEAGRRAGLKHPSDAWSFIDRSKVELDAAGKAEESR